MAMAGGSDISITIQAITEGQENIESLLRSFGGLQDQGNSLGSSLSTLAPKFAAVGAAVSALTGIVVATITKFAEFDDAMRKTASVSGGAGTFEEKLESMSDRAREMGETTRFTAVEAADGMQMLAMAGLSAADTMAAIPDVLNLASAAAVDLGTSADILTNIMAQYGIETSELTRVTDVLVGTFTKSNTNLQELGDAMKYVGPVAKTLGMDIEETAAALGVLADSGYKGQMGGTALRNILVALVAPTTNAGKLFKKLGVDTNEMGIDMASASNALASLGVEVKDAEGNIRPFTDIMDDLQSGLERIPDPAARAATVMTIFGKRAGPAMSALLIQGSDAIRDLNDELNNVFGISQRVSDQMESGIGGSFRKLNSAIGEVVLAMADEFAPSVQETTDEFRDFITASKQLAVQFAGLVADVWDGVKAFFDFSLIGETVSALFLGMKISIAALRDGFNTVVSLLQIGIGTAVQHAAGAVSTLLDSLSGIVGLVSSDMAMAIQVAADATREASEAGVRFAEDGHQRIMDMESELYKVLDELFNGVVDQKDKATRAIDALVAALETEKQKYEDGVISLDEYRANLQAMGEEAKKAAEAGNLAADEKAKIFRLINDEVESASESIVVFGDHAADVGIVFGDAATRISTDGMVIIDSLRAIANESATISDEVSGNLAQVSRALEDIKQKSLFAGDGLVEAFREGVDNAKTIADLKAIADEAEAMGEAWRLSGEAVAKAVADAEDKISSMAAASIAAAPNIGELRKALQEIGDVSAGLANEIGEKLNAELEKMSMTDLSRLSDQMKSLFATNQVDADVFHETMEAITETMGQKMGLAAVDMQTGISDAISSALSDFEEFAKQANVSTDMVTEAFRNMIAKAETEKDLVAIRDRFAEFAEDSEMATSRVNLVMGELGDKLEEVKKGTLDAAGAMRDYESAQAAFEDVLSDTTAAMSDVDSAAATMRASIVAAFHKGALSTEEMDDALADLDKSVADHADGMSGALKDAWEQGGISFGEYRDKVGPILKGELSDAVNAYNQTIAAGSSAYGAQQEAADRLKAVLEDCWKAGVISADEYNRKLGEIEKSTEAVEKAGEKAGETLDEAMARVGSISSILAGRVDAAVHKVEELGVKAMDTIRATFDGWEMFGSGLFGQSLQNTIAHANNMLDDYANKVAHVADVVSNVGVATMDTVRQTHALIDTMDYLDDVKLKELHDQVDELKYKIMEARDAATEMVQDLKEELLELQGKTFELEEMRFEERRKELQTLIEGTADEVARAEYEEALVLLEQIQQEKMADLMEEESQRMASNDRVYRDQITKGSSVHQMTLDNLKDQAAQAATTGASLMNTIHDVSKKLEETSGSIAIGFSNFAGASSSTLQNAMGDSVSGGGYAGMSSVPGQTVTTSQQMNLNIDVQAEDLWSENAFHNKFLPQFKKWQDSFA